MKCNFICMTVVFAMISTESFAKSGDSDPINESYSDVMSKVQENNNKDNIVARVGQLEVAVSQIINEKNADPANITRLDETSGNGITELTNIVKIGLENINTSQKELIKVIKGSNQNDIKKTDDKVSKKELSEKKDIKVVDHDEEFRDRENNLKKSVKSQDDKKIDEKNDKKSQEENKNLNKKEKIKKDMNKETVEEEVVANNKEDDSNEPNDIEQNDAKASDSVNEDKENHEKVNNASDQSSDANIVNDSEEEPIQEV